MTVINKSNERLERKQVSDALTSIENNLLLAKSYSFVSRQGSSGTYYLAGYYETSATAAILNQASTSVGIGAENNSTAAHAFVVAGGAGTVDAGTLLVTVSGTSITDAGVRTPDDSQVIVVDCTAAATDGYFETSKKWLGSIVFTLSSVGGSTFGFDFNYGLCKYEDLGNRGFTITDIEFVGLANANDSGANFSVLHHKDTGWTYSVGAFAPNPEVIWDMNTDHVTEKNLVSGKHFAYKRASLAEVITGADSEGFIIRVDTSSNASIAYMNAHITSKLDLV